MKRRNFLTQISIAAGAAFALPGINALSGSAFGLNQNPQKKLGIALLGLGNYSTGQLAPALQQTTKCYLAGIVTGSPDKAIKWKTEYNIPAKNIYNYDNFDSIKDNSDIDIVYVVTPNALHAQYAIRAAKAGKHVISEKPMEVSVAKCQDMIDACKENNRMLSIGYRLHFEPHNLEMMRLGQNKVFGKVKKISSEHGFRIQNHVWRLDKKLAGGGPLMDVGIYSVQGACYTLGEEPLAVTAKFGKKTDPEKFNSVEESISWKMEFPSGAIAECNTSYAKGMNLLRADAEQGWFQLSPAFAYNGIEGTTSKGKMQIPNVVQQALQMDAFAESIMTKQQSIVPGEMGLRDVKLLMAIYKAAETAKRISIT